MIIQETSLSIENLKFSRFDSVIELENMIYEGEGSCSLSDLDVAFQISDSSELYVNFDLWSNGRIYEDSGDYWTPPYCNIEVDEIDITINNVYIDGDEFKLNYESIKALEKLIKNNING